MRLSINASAHICRWICFSSSPNQTAQCFILRAFSSPLRAFRTIIFKHLLTIFTLEIIWLHDSGPSTRRICDLFLFERRHNWTKHHVTVRGALKVCNKYNLLSSCEVQNSEFDHKLFICSGATADSLMARIPEQQWWCDFHGDFDTGLMWRSWALLSVRLAHHQQYANDNSYWEGQD